jgi:hypothetical protein
MGISRDLFYLAAEDRFQPVRDLAYANERSTCCLVEQPLRLHVL